MKLLPAVKAPVLLSKPTAPIISSSACEVVAGVASVQLAAVVPELGVVLFPVAVWHRSLGEGETIPLKEKRVAAILTALPEVTVIVLFDRARVAGAEKTTVRTPLVPLPVVVSASIV